jgi:hypothetical protein
VVQGVASKVSGVATRIEDSNKEGLTGDHVLMGWFSRMIIMNQKISIVQRILSTSGHSVVM